MTRTTAVAAWVTVRARAGQGRAVADFLRSAAGTVAAEPATAAWFAVQLGPTSFATFAAFADDAGRQAHLGGAVATGLTNRSADLLAGPPVVDQVDVLADKVTGAGATKGLWILMDARAGKAADAVAFLNAAKPMIDTETFTVAWFAVQVSASQFAIFDAFPDDHARDRHLMGKVAAALMAASADLFVRAPNLERADVLAHHGAGAR